MGKELRRLLTFTCEGAVLTATVDGAAGSTGILFATGGSQTRIGSHRMFERLARGLAAAGYPCLRFDRRGVGDSEGEDPGFRGAAPDLAAAAAALRTQCPSVRGLLGIGLCDGATALALGAAGAGLDGVVMVNPWLVEAELGAPPAAAIKRHYREQLTSLSGWKRLLSGSISYRKLLKGLLKTARPEDRSLATATAAALEASEAPVALILARGDATAIAAESVWATAPWRAIRSRSAVTYVESDSHTFAGPGDDQALLAACLAALDRLGNPLANVG